MTIIRKIASCLLLAAVIPSAFAMPGPEEAHAINVAETASDTRACGCQDNGVGDRWEDDMDPVGRITELCARGGGCYQAQIGRMCVNGDLRDCSCAISTARDLQHLDQDGNWWLRVCQMRTPDLFSLPVSTPLSRSLDKNGRADITRSRLSLAAGSVSPSLGKSQTQAFQLWSVSAGMDVREGGLQRGRFCAVLDSTLLVAVASQSLPIHFVGG